MPRVARPRSSTGIYHLIMRGVNRQIIFHDNEDRQRFLKTLGHFKEASKYVLYGYCLMDNHIHLLLKETEETVSAAVKRVSASFVYWYNRKYGRCGHLFQERYRSEVVEDEKYFLTVLRYIHQNPVKAGLTKSVGEYKWSSYAEYIDRAEIISKEFALEIFSSDTEEATESFAVFMNAEDDDKCLEYEGKLLLSDSQVKGHFASFGIEDLTVLESQLDRSKRNQIIRDVKSLEGVSVRQLSRITGLSKSLIARL